MATVDPISLALLAPPGEYGADIAVAEGQPLGNYPSYGGPTLGVLAARGEYMRKLPGRIVGETRDIEGRRAFVLTLQTREQHIRRERATSNICTNQGLMALRAAIYLGALGREGLREVARLCLQKAHYAARRLAALDGYSLPYGGPFFREFVLECPRPARELNAQLLEEGIVGGLPLERFFPDGERRMLVSMTERIRREDIDRLVEVLETGER